MVEGVRAETLEDAIAAAERLGFPVALKTAAPGMQHKSDVGGVRLGVDDSPSLEDAYGDLERRLGPQVTVAPMAPPGVEIALGVVRDPQFGPLVLVGAGGVLVEVLKDRRLAMPPLDEDASTLDDRSTRRFVRCSKGSGGNPRPTSMRSRGAIVSFPGSRIDLGDHLEALDANPIICGPDGCVAVDALVIPSSP